MPSFKLKPVLIALLATILIVACQNKTVRQPSSSQLVDCRTVQHALGEACVPKTPQRLVSLDQITLADALTLGVPSIGAAITDSVQIDYLNKHIENYGRMESVGQSTQPSLEKILMLKPDLIMGIEFFGEPIFPQLSQIAPTAVGEWVGYPSWREYFNFVARVLNKKAKAKQVWDSYYRRIAEIKMALGDRLQDVKVSTVYAYNGAIHISTTRSFIGSILADVGISQPTYAAAPDNAVISLSEETIPDINADILFVSVYNAESEQTLADWQQKPLWNNLKAVRKGQVYVVNANIWDAGNPIAANLVLDDLYKYLVEK